LIGVISKESEKETVREFFELFKTPWEFYRDDRSYDVVLCTEDHASPIKAELLVIYASEKMEFDSENGIVTTSKKRKAVLEYNEKDLPIYQEVATFEGDGKPPVRLKGTREFAGTMINGKSQKILRIGFNLFEEIFFFPITIKEL